MWRILEMVVLMGIVLFSITEFFIPLLFNKPILGSFRKVKPPEIEKKDSLEEKLSKAKEQVNEVKDVQNEISENFKTAEQLKEESDNLLQ